ncbi:MAG: pyruvate kinase, partial [gamma proteobacterium symbiont of Ctena orbiculata]
MTAIPIRKTKIVATIGPASDSVDTLEEMIVAGMSVARLNLSHGSYEEHRQRIERIRQASENLNIPVAIMIDTRGVEIRT